MTQEAPVRQGKAQQASGHAVLVLRGRDRTGIVAAVGAVLGDHGANIVSLDQ